MNSIARLADPTPDTEVVDELLLRVAQRADQLAHAAERGREHDLEHWLQAEREMFANLTPTELTPAN
jgi:hypothetical protein